MQIQNYTIGLLRNMPSGKYKIDMGKSCVRFKRMNDIPIDLIGKLMTKLSVQDWISMYETAFVKNK